VHKEPELAEYEKPVAEYEKPEVVDYGTLAALTAGASTGSRLDANFSAGTFFGELTFS
jgi:hypothetical protein